MILLDLVTNNDEEKERCTRVQMSQGAACRSTINCPIRAVENWYIFGFRQLPTIIDCNVPSAVSGMSLSLIKKRLR